MGLGWRGAVPIQLIKIIIEPPKLQVWLHGYRLLSRLWLEAWGTEKQLRTRNTSGSSIAGAVVKAEGWRKPARAGSLL